MSAFLNLETLAHWKRDYRYETADANRTCAIMDAGRGRNVAEFEKIRRIDARLLSSFELVTWNLAGAVEGTTAGACQAKSCRLHSTCPRIGFRVSDPV